jgi:phosphoglycerol transferase
VRSSSHLQTCDGRSDARETLSLVSQPDTPSSPPATAALAACLSVAILSLGVAAWQLQLWRSDLSVPLGYSADSLSASVYIKGMLDTGWYTRNHMLGAPWGMVLYDYPSLHTLHFAIMKVMGLFLKKYAPLMNAYYLLTFPLVGVAAVAALRQLGMAYPVAVAGAILFSVTPYHFTLGGIGELFLSAYFAVPLAVMLGWWVVRRGGGSADQENSRVPPHRWRRAAGILCACVVIALSHIYYVVFSLLVILLSGIWAALRGKGRGRFLLAVIMTATIAGISAVNHLPVLLYARNAGLSPAATQRDVAGPMRHGLTIASMLIPSSSHGIDWIKSLQDAQAETVRSETVRGGAYLGVVGVVGLVLLLVQFFRAAAGRALDSRLAFLAVLTVALLLVATVGGFGYVLGLVTVPIVRYYSRVSVYIAFLSLAATFLLVDAVRTRATRVHGGPWLFAGALGALVIVGAIDQRSTRDLPAYSEIRPQYRSDEKFVAAIERFLPDSAMVFQLPHVPFPEGTGRYRMRPYDPGRMYLHSETLRWSFGAMRGRPGSLWLERVAERSPRQLVDGVCLMGFDGVCVARAGYPDAGAQIVSELTELLGEVPSRSMDNDLVFFPLTRYRVSLRDSLGPVEWESERAREHLLIASSSGLGGMVGATSRTWHWCGQTGELVVHNLSDTPIRCMVGVWLRAPFVESADLVVYGRGSRSRGVLSSQARKFAVTTTIAPGRNVYRFATDAPVTGGDEGGGGRAFAASSPEVATVHWVTGDEASAAAESAGSS